VSAAERDDESEDRDVAADGTGPATTALVPRAVDPRLRFVGHRDRGFGRLLGWNAVGIGLLTTAPLGPYAWAGIASIGGIGAVIYGWLSMLGRGQLGDRILRARAHLRTHPEQALGMLEALAEARLPAAYRLEAAGHAALIALERGDVAHAIDLLSFESADDGPGARARGLERGLVGELARSILAWLSPGAFERVASASAFELDPAQREGLARPGDVEEFLELVSLLRVLEATAAAEREPVLMAWRQCRDSGLARRFPRLFLIARAAAARRLPEIRDELEAQLLHRPDDQAFLQRVFPEFSGAGRGESVYREPAVVADGGDEADRALALVSAPPRVALAARRMAGIVEHREMSVVVIRQWLLLGAAATAATIMVGAIAGGAAGAWATSMLAAYVGAPVAVIGGLRGMRRGKARLRLAPLRRLDPPPAPEWMREFESSPPVRGAASGLAHEHMLLYVACVQAEHELVQGRGFEAWSLVEWYVRGVSPQRLELGTLFPVAASLVRICALTGHVEEARRLSDGMAAAVAAGRRGQRHRTAYGSAPGALARARALVLARAGKWSEVPTQLELTARLPDVWMAERDRALYDLVALVARQRSPSGSLASSPVPDPARLEPHIAWIARLAPELLEDLEIARQ
jgi:hypothetical protein